MWKGFIMPISSTYHIHSYFISYNSSHMTNLTAKDSEESSLAVSGRRGERILSTSFMANLGKRISTCRIAKITKGLCWG